MLGLTFVFDLALNNLLLEGCILGKENKMLSMLFGYFDCNLHSVLLSVYVLIIAPKRNPVNQKVNQGVVKKPHKLDEVPRRIAGPSGLAGGIN
jgi:hypothetical protein